MIRAGFYVAAWHLSSSANRVPAAVASGFGPNHRGIILNGGEDSESVKLHWVIRFYSAASAWDAHGVTNQP